MQNVTDTIDKSSSWKKPLIVLKLKQTLEASGLRVMARIQQGIDDGFHQYVNKSHFNNSNFTEKILVHFKDFLFYFSAL